MHGWTRCPTVARELNVDTSAVGDAHLTCASSAQRRYRSHPIPTWVRQVPSPASCWLSPRAWVPVARPIPSTQGPRRCINHPGQYPELQAEGLRFLRQAGPSALFNRRWVSAGRPRRQGEPSQGRTGFGVDGSCVGLYVLPSIGLAVRLRGVGIPKALWAVDDEPISAERHVRPMASSRCLNLPGSPRERLGFVSSVRHSRTTVATATTAGPKLAQQSTRPQ